MAKQMVMIRTYRQRITIIKYRKPVESTINQELQWVGNSLGLFNLRDKDKSCFRLFIEMLKAAKSRRVMSSDELGYRLGLTRGTIIHHLNRLIESGLVVRDGNRYFLRVESLSSLIDEVERDIKQTCEDLRKVAEDIDEKLGL